MHIPCRVRISISQLYKLADLSFRKSSVKSVPYKEPSSKKKTHLVKQAAILTKYFQGIKLLLCKFSMRLQAKLRYCNRKNNFLISQPKQMLWILKQPSQ